MKSIYMKTVDEMPLHYLKFPCSELLCSNNKENQCLDEDTNYCVRIIKYVTKDNEYLWCDTVDTLLKRISESNTIGIRAKLCDVPFYIIEINDILGYAQVTYKNEDKDCINAGVIKDSLSRDRDNYSTVGNIIEGLFKRADSSY